MTLTPSSPPSMTTASWKRCTKDPRVRPGGRASVLRGALRDVSRSVPHLGSEAYGDDVFVTWGTVHGTMDGAWLGIEPTHRSFTAAFVNVVPFRNGKMQGEQIYFDLRAMCLDLGVSVEEVLMRAGVKPGPAN